MKHWGGSGWGARQIQKKRHRFCIQRYRDYKVRYLSNNNRNTQHSLGALASFRRVLSTPTRSAISCWGFLAQRRVYGFHSAVPSIFFLPTSFMAKQPPCQTKEPQRRTLHTRPLVLLPLVFTTSFAATSYRVADL